MEDITTSPLKKSEEPSDIREGSDPFGELPDYGTDPLFIPTEKPKLAGRPRKGETKEEARRRRAVEHFRRKREESASVDAIKSAPVDASKSGAPSPYSSAPSSFPAPPLAPEHGSETPKRTLSPKALKEARKHVSRATVEAIDGAVLQIASKKHWEGMGASPSEKEVLAEAWEAYLEAQEIEVSPGWVLIATTVAVYGPKLASQNK